MAVVCHRYRCGVIEHRPTVRLDRFHARFCAQRLNLFRDFAAGRFCESFAIRSDHSNVYRPAMHIGQLGAPRRAASELFLGTDDKIPCSEFKTWPND
jgi:hypothetical protein